jgi:endo-1,4-beta-D-glucanase Y
MNILHRYDCTTLSTFNVIGGSGVSTRLTGGIDGECIQVVPFSTPNQTGIEVFKPYSDQLKIASFFFRPLYNSIQSTNDGVIAKYYTSNSSNSESEVLRLVVKKHSDQKYKVGLFDVSNSSVVYANDLLDISYNLDLNQLSNVPAGGLTDPFREDMKASTVGLNKFTIEFADSEVRLFISIKQSPSAVIPINSTSKNLTKIFLGSDVNTNLFGSKLIYDDIKLGSQEARAITRETQAIHAAKGWVDRFITNNGCLVRYSERSIDNYIYKQSYNPNLPIVTVTVTTGGVEVNGGTFNGSPNFVPNTPSSTNVVYFVKSINENKYMEYNGTTYTDFKSQVDNISEGVGYGMRMAFATGDKVMFDKIENFTEQRLTRKNSKPNTIPTNEQSKGKNCMNWKYNPTLNVSYVTDVATDGDEDRAIALIEAHFKWGSTGAINYKARAIAICEDIWNDISSPFAYKGKTLRVPVISLNTVQPNNSLANPSYFNPQLWKMMVILTGNQKWNNLTNGIYAFMEIMNAYNGSGMPNNFVPFNWDGTIRVNDLENDTYHRISSIDAVRYWFRMYQDFDINKDQRVINSGIKGANYMINYNPSWNAPLPDGYYPVVACKSGINKVDFLGSIENAAGIGGRLFSDKIAGDTTREKRVANLLFSKYENMADGGLIHDNYFGSLDLKVPTAYYSCGIGTICALLYTNKLSNFPKTGYITTQIAKTGTGTAYAMKMPNGKIYKIKTTI